jgi:hypothetical protein
MNWIKSFWRKLNAPVAPRVVVLPRSGIVQGASQSDESMSNFTPRAQKVLALARQEADRFNHNFVGTEHLLLGLIRLGQGTAMAVLNKKGLDLETVRRETEKQIGIGPDQNKSGNIPYTPRVRKALALAAKEAKALNHTYVGTEHLLLGLLREGDGVAARILVNLGLDVETTRLDILKQLDPNFDPATPSAASVVSSASPSTTNPSEGKTATSLRVASFQSPREELDISKRYDVYCTTWGQATVVYRNARFKGVKHLFPTTPNNPLAGYIELEQSDGQTIFISRSSIIRFCEPGVAPNPESV